MSSRDKKSFDLLLSQIGQMFEVYDPNFNRDAASYFTEDTIYTIVSKFKKILLDDFLEKLKQLSSERSRDMYSIKVEDVFEIMGIYTDTDTVDIVLNYLAEFSDEQSYEFREWISINKERFDILKLEDFIDL